MYEFFTDAKYTKKSGKSQNVVALAMEYIANGEFFDFIAQEKFSEKMARSFFIQIFNGISYLHS